MLTFTLRQNSGIRVALGTVSVLVPGAGYLATIQHPLSIGTLLMVLFLVSSATLYMVAVRSLRGTICFGFAIMLLSILPWLAAALDDSMTDTGGGLAIAGSSTTALILAISAAAVDRILRRGEAETNHRNKPLAEHFRPLGQTVTTDSRQQSGHDGEAIASFVSGILGIILFPILLSIPAIVLGKRSIHRLTSSDPSVKGTDIARAGVVMGWIGLGYGLPLLAVLYWALT